MIEIGAGKGAPAALGHQQVAGLLVQFGDDFGKIVGQGAGHTARRFGAPRRTTHDVDQHHLQAMAAKCLCERPVAADNAVDRINRGGRLG